MKWVRRLRRADRRVIDRTIAALLLVAGELELLFSATADKLSYALIFAVAYGSLAFRRSHPLAVGTLIFSLWVLVNLTLVDLEQVQIPLIAVLFAAYAMGAYTTGTKALAAPFVVFAGMMAIVSTFEDQVFTDYVFPTAFALFAWLAGRGVRTRTHLTEELHEAAMRAQEAHDAELARAAADERRRIAREMHDVVAHSVSVMVVQAGGARRILERDPARAVEAAARIEEVGRAALSEMRRLLGVMHHGEGDAGRAPQPSLRELDALVERSRAAGLPVSLSVEGEPRSLSAGKDLAAYRVVQEALTNAIKHASAAPTDVTLRWQPDHLELQIVDRGAPKANGNGSGHGLVGMEERMKLYDGEVRAGHRDGGGFEVVARMPL